MKEKEKPFVPPCDRCGGKCCEYIAIEIGKPVTKTDFDHIRWYLLHHKVHVFIDHDKKWYVEFRSPCEAQDSTKRCRIYGRRPKICRDHGNVDGECEYFDNPYKRYFKSADEFEKYLEYKGIDWRFKKLS